MKKILVLAIILRLLVSVFFLHPDIKTYSYQASFLKKGVFNIYTYLTENKKNLPLKDDFVYFPLTYLFLGGYQAIVSPIVGGGLDSWLSDAGVSSAVRNPQIFKYLFALKLPYLVLDIWIAYLLKKFFDDKKLGEKAFTLWLFNPFTIILVYVYSNVDILPVFLTLISFLLIKRQRNLLAATILGLAAGFKLYPLLFTPFLFLKGKTLKEKLLLGATPFAVFLAICLPFMSQDFIQSALVSGLTIRIFNPGFSVGFNESIIVGLTAIALAFFWAYLEDSDINLFKYWIAIFILVFSFSHFNIQWLMWLAPFIIIVAVKIPKLSWTLFWLGLVAFLIPMLFEDRFMTVSLFRIYTTWYDLLPTPFAIVQRFYDPYNLQSILHSILAAGGIITVYRIFKEKISL